jgi:hypothetical protein
MEIRAIVLLLFCLTALLRPAWGIALLLVAECSLFHPEKCATVSLPLGYAGPSDVGIVCIVLGAFLARWRPDRGLPPSPPCKEEREDFARKTLAWSIIPFVAWMGVQSWRGVSEMIGQPQWSVSVRNAVSALLPWSLVAAVWWLRRRRREILLMVVVVAAATSALHVAIQFLDLRNLMVWAYWTGPEQLNEYQEYVLSYFDFVRGLPQGTILILLTAILCFYWCLTVRAGRGALLGLVALVGIMATAIGITLTRSLAVELAAGMLLTLVLAWKVSGRIVPPRATYILLSLVLAAGLTLAVRPDILPSLTERVEALDVDRRIFSDQTIRGQDNLASLEAIQDRPWCGWGLYTYPEEYSFREDAATDIHTLLRVALAGGWIGVFLAIRLQGLLVWRFWRACRRQAAAAMPRVAPYLAILATSLLVIFVPTPGISGTLMGQALIAMSVFIGLLAAEYARADTSDTPAEPIPSARHGASPGATPP